MLLTRHRPPLWAAVLLAPLFYNTVAIAVAALGYAAIGRPALLSILVVWIGSAGRLLTLIERYEPPETRRALAVLGALVWLVVSFGLMAAAAHGIARLAG
jgi:hypothetical protein